MNIKTTIVLSLLMSIAFSVGAQPYKTIYFNKRGLKTKKKQAYTYRTIIGVEDSNLLVKDYYMNGTICMTGSYATTDPLLVEGPAAKVIREGAFTYYYPSGYMKEKAYYKAGRLDGKCVSYYDSIEQIKVEAYYHSGTLTKTLKGYYKNGKLEFVHNYKNGKKYGISTEYVWKDKGYEKVIYDNGDVLRNTDPPADSSAGEAVYENTVMPEPLYDVLAYLNKKVKYPKEAWDLNIQGRVMVQFVVDEKGYITDVVSKSPELDYRLQMEAIRVVSEMPRWKKPGVYKGEPVKVYYTLPIGFFYTTE